MECWVGQTQHRHWPDHRNFVFEVRGPQKHDFDHGWLSKIDPDSWPPLNWPAGTTLLWKRCYRRVTVQSTPNLHKKWRWIPWLVYWRRMYGPFLSQCHQESVKIVPGLTRANHQLHPRHQRSTTQWSFRIYLGWGWRPRFNVSGTLDHGILIQCCIEAYTKPYRRRVFLLIS